MTAGVERRLVSDAVYGNLIPTPDGAHLDYLTTDNTLMEVDVQSGKGFAITATRARFRLDVNPVSSSDYDLASDGRVIANGGEADPSPLTVVANWR